MLSWSHMTMTDNGGQARVTDEARQSDAADKSNNIVLVGFSGVGKSTVGRKLARRLNMMSLDTDIYISRELGISCQDYLKSEGVEAFRACERNVLERLHSMENCIISCGGGTVVDAESRRLITTLGTVVYLMIDPDEAVSHITHLSTRPLLCGEKTPRELFDERAVYYEEVADYVIDVSGMSSTRVATAIVEKLRAAGVIKE